MKPNIIAQITKAITKIQGCQFASLTYLSKKHGELARYTANFGFSYHQIIEKSITELDILIRENETVWDSTWKLAAAELMESFKETLAARPRGTKQGLYQKGPIHSPWRWCKPEHFRQFHSTLWVGFDQKGFGRGCLSQSQFCSQNYREEQNSQDVAGWKFSGICD